MKNAAKVFAFLLVFVMLCASGIVYAISFFARDISFVPEDDNFKATNVEEALNELYKQSGNSVNGCIRGKYIAGNDCATSDGCLVYEGFEPKLLIARNSEPSAVIYDYNVNPSYYTWENSQAAGRHLFSDHFEYRDGKLYSKNQSGYWINNSEVEFLACK